MNMDSAQRIATGWRRLLACAAILVAAPVANAATAFEVELQGALGVAKAEYIIDGIE